LEEIGHRGDVVGSVGFGGDLVLRDSAALARGQSGFDVLQVIDLGADEVGDAAILVEGLLGWAGYADGFHRDLPINRW
jgi:hypothetical protein